MPQPDAKLRRQSLRNLPSIDEVLRNDGVADALRQLGAERSAVLARVVVAEMRTEAKAGKVGTKAEVLADAVSKFNYRTFLETVSGTQRVINATGVVIHTNLGRAPLSIAAQQAIIGSARYCTLEYYVAEGKRGRRGRRAEDLLAQLTGAEDALIVNNCAAAAFFVLTAFAAGGEVVISRGEMVEIGGDFRVPDVLSQSGGKLREVGTTNRTRLSDFEKAINKKTRMILRVHPSNYRIVGFTAMPSLLDLSTLTKKRKLILYEDIGSGALIDLSDLGLKDEPVVSRSLADGADVVTFSGDKLLGGPQAGIIAGRKGLIEKLRQHPLYRALRVDKLAYAGLEATLEAYVRGAATAEIPVLAMLGQSGNEIDRRATSFIASLRLSLGRSRKAKIEKVPGNSAIGGGAAPAVQPETTLIAITHKSKTAVAIEQALRLASVPVIARIVNDRVVIDLRTVSETEGHDLVTTVANVLGS